MEQELLKSKTNVVLIRENATSLVATSTFDYSDLNAYLLVVIGLSRPEGNQIQLFNDIMAKAQQGGRIALSEIQSICRQEPLIDVSAEGNLAHAIEILGSGIHRLLVTDASCAVVGILSQLRMIEFFWNEGVNFPTIDRLYSSPLRDLGIGTHHIVSVK